ncbi:serine/threonine protein kinase Sgk2 [Histoplasma capsulatum var. duboisii H88]|uniref:non-specific serine/threonine protein kinase n=1 Tax=Ajellomyces capsulatus (strain H88) TaxID=544711 RepID=F0UNT6_AJEC8|nr:serine/threonine protein kinase Sgk2 [Histoplasma capsulatum var. duboisii H88]QSS53014.1 serine/threonine protein kinase Sgk2 [Histoplasma capsulatum var. duboisii H88]
MAGLSQEDRNIIKNHPLTNLVDDLRGALQEAERIYESRLISYDGAVDSLDQLYRNAISKLVYTLQGEGAAYSLPSRISDGDVASDLAQLFERLRKAKGNFRYNDYQPLVHLVIQRPPTESQNAEPWNFDVWKAVFTLIDTLPRRTTPPASVPPSFDGTPVKSTSSSQKGSEQTLELVNPRIFEEIHGCTFPNVEGFFEKYFEEKNWSSKADAICRRVLAPTSDGNWAQFPDPPTQNNVLAWWFRLQEDLLLESRGTYYTTASKADLTGSQAERQVDLLLRARGGTPSRNKHDWRDILVVGELKKSTEEIKTKGTLLQMSRYVREVFTAQPTRRFVHAFAVCGTKMEAWVFDRSGPYSSGVIDVYEDSRRFFQVLVGYTMMSDEELGLDIFIARDEGGNKSITVKGPGNSEEKVLRLGEMLSFQRAIVCRGTTCFLANDGQVEGVAKFSWVSDKRRPEAELLELAGQRNVQGVARIIGHSTITNIADMRRDMAFDDRRHDFKSAPPSTTSSFHQSQPLTEPCRLDIRRKSSSRKRRSPDKGMQAFKRSRPINQTSGDTQEHLAFSVQSAHKPSLFDRNGEELYDNRVLRCLVISPAGRPIYKYESPLELLKALRDAIKAHRSLYLDGNILHRDISENNIIITDSDKADGYSGTLIDLDLAKEVGSGRSGARHQTGTMEFMAIEVLLNIDHTYRHDLESFFYVLIWQCARHGWGKDNHPKDSKLRAWYTGNYEDIANAKLGHMSKAENMGFGFILREFPPKLRGVVPLCRALRDILFPYNDKGLIVGTPQDPIRLYDPIIKAYDDTIAQFELGNLTSDKSV